MEKQIKRTILEQARDWFESDRKVILARVIQTWGSSPCPVGSNMIVNDKGEFFGSVSCLLYTSPSPRDVEESRMPSSA